MWSNVSVIIVSDAMCSHSSFWCSWSDLSMMSCVCIVASSSMMLSLIIDIFVDVLYIIDLYSLADIHDCVDKLCNVVSSDPWHHWGISASSDLQLHLDIHDHISLYCKQLLHWQALPYWLLWTWRSTLINSPRVPVLTINITYVVCLPY